MAMTVPCDVKDCEREATHYWWLKVENGCAERLFCYVHAQENYQQDVAAFGERLIPGTDEVSLCP
jgi:hypothetical protein